MISILGVIVICRKYSNYFDKFKEIIMFFLQNNKNPINCPLIWGILRTVALKPRITLISPIRPISPISPINTRTLSAGIKQITLIITSSIRDN